VSRQALEARWTGLLTALGCGPEAARAAFAAVAANYSAPERHYHTLDHVRDVLDTVTSLWGTAEPPPALLLAAWLHDVVYDTHAADNEERSADHARALLRPLGLSEGLLDEAARLILLTKGHRADAGDRAGQVLLDADLAVLGADEAAYDRYAAAIRREYAWVPEADYRAGRSRVLEDFLRRPRVYHTEEMHARAEALARANLRREIALLAT
jgi:predicted metal-dependent HD superfamily phosphohydrolase